MKSTKTPMLGPAGLELERLLIEPHGVSLFVRLWRNLDESKAVAFVDPMIVLGGVQEASLQQLEVRPPVHLALDELQAVDLAFCLPAAPLVC